MAAWCRWRVFFVPESQKSIDVSSSSMRSQCSCQRLDLQMRNDGGLLQRCNLIPPNKKQFVYNMNPSDDLESRCHVLVQHVRRKFKEKRKRKMERDRKKPFGQKIGAKVKDRNEIGLKKIGTPPTPTSTPRSWSWWSSAGSWNCASCRSRPRRRSRSIASGSRPTRARWGTEAGSGSGSVASAKASPFPRRRTSRCSRRRRSRWRCRRKWRRKFPSEEVWTEFRTPGAYLIKLYSFFWQKRGKNV